MSLTVTAPPVDVVEQVTEAWASLAALVGARPTIEMQDDQHKLIVLLDQLGSVACNLGLPDSPDLEVALAARRGLRAALVCVAGVALMWASAIAPDGRDRSLL